MCKFCKHKKNCTEKHIKQHNNSTQTKWYNYSGISKPYYLQIRQQSWQGETAIIETADCTEVL